jgi:hypothetical protein
MYRKEIKSVADQLTQRATIRAEAVDAWVALALEQPDPIAWSEALVAAALIRLDEVAASRKVKAEAKQQLLDIQRAMQDGLERSFSVQSRFGQSTRAA